MHPYAPLEIARAAQEVTVVGVEENPCGEVMTRNIMRQAYQGATAAAPPVSR